VAAAFDAPWRFVFYLNVPIGIAAAAVAWASTDWDTPRQPGRLDLAAAALISLSLAGILGGLTLAGSQGPVLGSLEAGTASWLLVASGIGLGALGVLREARREGSIGNVVTRFRGAFGAALLVSALTGYAFATAIIGGAVFVDRVLYGGPDAQRLTLGALAAATAIGALGAGLLARATGLRGVTLAGLALGSLALVAAAGWTPATPTPAVALGLAAFGLGFGLTVTPRSTAAVEALGREAFGVASAGVTVARMLGMAIGLAVLTAYGSTTIDRLWSAIQATPEAYRDVIPAELRDRPIRDGLVVQALEAWASGEAARVMVGVFLVAAAINTAGILPAIRLADSGRMLPTDQPGDGPPARDGGLGVR
jgi:hypothetical protein